MTPADVHGPPAGDGPTIEQDLAGLRIALASHPFPTRQDDLIAACLGRGEPARLCCRLSTLDHDAVYENLDEVLDAVAAASLLPPR